MTSSITFLVDGDEKVLLVCQLDIGSTCNAITYTDLVQLLQEGNPPLNMAKSKLKLFSQATSEGVYNFVARAVHGSWEDR